MGSAGRAPGEEDARDRARQHFDRGVALMQNEDWDAAAVAFEQSLGAFATPSALFNLGMCRKALHKYVAAIEAFERWEAEFGAEAPEDEVERVAHALGELRGFIGELLVTVDVPGARILVNGVPVGVAPMGEPVAIEMGHYTVAAVLDGYGEASGQVTVGSGERIEVTLALLEDAGAPAEAGVGSAWFWSLAGTAAALGVAAGVTGGLALGANGDYEAGGYRDGDLRDRGMAYQLATNILAGTAGAAAIAAAVLAFFTDFGAEAPPGDEGPTALVWPSGFVVAW